MRIIKFRAWDGKNMVMNPLSFGQQFPMNELMQFTGLFDKNGKEIYEGDIIRGNGNNLFAIIPMLGGLSICNTHYLGQKHNELISEPTNDAQSAQWLKESEVIGNVYENPELLKATP